MSIERRPDGHLLIRISPEFAYRTLQAFLGFVLALIVYFITH